MLFDEFFDLPFFGALAEIVSSLHSMIGILKKWPIVLIVVGVWSIPATYYLSAGFGLPVFLTELFVFGAACAVHKNKIRTAWLLLIPLFFFRPRDDLFHDLQRDFFQLISRRPHDTFHQTHPCPR